MGSYIDFAASPSPTAFSVTTVFVRKCYAQLYKLLTGGDLPNLQRQLFGNSGVGKTAFILYFVHRLLLDQRVVVLFDHRFDSTVWTLRNVDGMVHVHTSSTHDAWHAKCDVANTWLVADGVPKSALAVRGCPALCVTSSALGVTDPRVGPVTNMYLPVWTRAELHAAAAHTGHAIAEVDAAFDVHGGLPRCTLTSLQDVAAQTASLESELRWAKRLKLSPCSRSATYGRSSHVALTCSCVETTAEGPGVVHDPHCFLQGQRVPASEWVAAWFRDEA